MPRKAAGLSARRVETVKAAGMYADGGGLYLQVTAAGSKSWIFRYTVARRRREMGLGSVSTISLAEARRVASDARAVVERGDDPIEARRRQEADAAVAAAKAVTFKQCAESFIEARRPGWRNAKHAAQWESTLDAYAYGTIGSLPVGAVDTGLVCKVLEPIWSTKTETASRLRGRIEAILDYAKVRGHRSGENPARWRGHLDHILPARGAVAKVKHHAALPYADLPDFWTKLRAQDGMGAVALSFGILTAARTSEVLGATWDEIDLAEKVWIVPAERMKAGAEHRVPLSDPAVALLRAVGEVRQGAIVFPGHKSGRPLSNMAMIAVMRRMKVAATPHGCCRASFKTWAAEATSFQREVVEASLAHTVGDEVEAAYLRGTFFRKRRQLMEAWGRFVSGGGRANVTALPMAKAG